MTLKIYSKISKIDTLTTTFLFILDDILFQAILHYSYTYYYLGSLLFPRYFVNKTMAYTLFNLLVVRQVPMII